MNKHIVPAREKKKRWRRITIKTRNNITLLLIKVLLLDDKLQNVILTHFDLYCDSLISSLNTRMTKKKRTMHNYS